MKSQLQFSGKNKNIITLSSAEFAQSMLGVMLDSMFVCLCLSSQPNGVMSSTVSLPNHTFTGKA